MTTRTDDISERLAVVENRLIAVEAGIQELRQDLRETNRSIAQVNAELHQGLAQMQSETNARFDRMQQQLNSRIDRLFYTALGGTVAVIGTLVLLIIRIGSGSGS